MDTVICLKEGTVNRMADIPKYFYFRVHANRTSIELEDASDADVVEVVRCRDCKNIDINDDEHWCWIWGGCTDENAYCSYGVKR